MGNGPGNWAKGKQGFQRTATGAEPPHTPLRHRSRRARIYGYAAAGMTMMPFVTTINPAMAFGGAAGLAVMALSTVIMQRN